MYRITFYGRLRWVFGELFYWLKEVEAKSEREAKDQIQKEYEVEHWVKIRAMKEQVQ